MRSYAWWYQINPAWQNFDRHDMLTMYLRIARIELSASRNRYFDENRVLAGMKLLCNADYDVLKLHIFAARLTLSFMLHLHLHTFLFTGWNASENTFNNLPSKSASKWKKFKFFVGVKLYFMEKNVRFSLGWQEKLGTKDTNLGLILNVLVFDWDADNRAKQLQIRSCFRHMTAHTSVSFIYPHPRVWRLVLVIWNETET